MKTFSLKQEARRGKKNKKLLALAKLVQLNDNDRRDTATNQIVSEAGETRTSKADDGFVKVYAKVRIVYCFN